MNDPKKIEVLIKFLVFVMAQLISLVLLKVQFVIDGHVVSNFPLYLGYQFAVFKLYFESLENKNDD